MKWKIEDRIVKDEHDNIVCMLSEEANSYHIALIRNASDMFDAIMDYNQSVESTTHPRNPKKHYERFKRLEEKINGEIE